MYGTRWHARRGLVEWNVFERNNLKIPDAKTAATQPTAKTAATQGTPTAATDESTGTEHKLVLLVRAANAESVDKLDFFRGHVDMWAASEQAKNTKIAIDDAEKCMRQRIQQDTLHIARVCINEVFSNDRANCDRAYDLLSKKCTQADTRVIAKYGAAMSAYRSFKRVASTQDTELDDDYEMQVTDDMSLLHVHSKHERVVHMHTLAGLAYSILLHERFTLTTSCVESPDFGKIYSDHFGTMDTVANTLVTFSRSTSQLLKQKIKHQITNFPSFVLPNWDKTTLAKIVDENARCVSDAASEHNTEIFDAFCDLEFKWHELMPANDNNPNYDAVVDFDDDAQWCAGASPCDYIDAFMGVQCLLRHLQF